MEDPEHRAEQRRHQERLREELSSGAKMGGYSGNAQFGAVGGKRLSKEVTKTTVNYELRALKTFFRWCLKRNLVFINPMETVEFRRIPKRSVPKFMTEDQIRRFLAAFSPRDRRVFSIPLHAGLRKGELQFLEWEGVDFERGVRWPRTDTAIRMGTCGTS